MTTISMTDVAQHLADYIDLVVTRGERFTLLHEGKPVAELGPVLTVVRGEDLPAVLTTLARLTTEEAGTLFREQGPLLTPVTSGPLAGR
jgi:antitoxin (DNA-binding transcriptional repressor) of toxin-antitoxin stability system